MKLSASYSPRRLHHSYGGSLIEAHVPITLVRDRMGHTSAVPTARYPRSRDDGPHRGILREAI